MTVGVATGLVPAGVATGVAGVVMGENAKGGVVAPGVPAGVVLGLGTAVTVGLTGAGAGAGTELGEGRAAGTRAGAGAGASGDAPHCEAVAGAMITASSHQKVVRSSILCFNDPYLAERSELQAWLYGMAFMTMMLGTLYSMPRKLITLYALQEMQGLDVPSQGHLLYENGHISLS